MFARLGWIIARHPVVIIAFWVALAVALAVLGPSQAVVAELEPPTLLPSDQPYNVSLGRISEAFGDLGARTKIVVIIEREEGLNDQDRAYMKSLTEELKKASHDRWNVISSIENPHLENRLLSQNGKSAMIMATHDMNFITRTAVQYSTEVADIAHQNVPEGLNVEITGEGGMGREIGDSTNKAFHRTTWVTIISVLVILILVYRAPLAALVPLLSIGVSVYVSLRFLDLLAAFGEDISDMERLFTVVLLFGTGVDYAMLWMARYWEKVEEEIGEEGLTGLIRQRSIGLSCAETGPAIVASAATTIAGFTMLLAGNLAPIHCAGRVLGVCLAVSMLASLTLTPAIARVSSKALFWPRRAEAKRSQEGGIWSWVARIVVAKPGMVALITLVLLIVPVWYGLNVKYYYDAFGFIPEGSSTERGQEMAERHFSAEQLFSWNLMVELPETDSKVSAEDAAAALGEWCRSEAEVVDVWYLDAPLGGKPATGITRSLTRSAAKPYYINEEKGCVRVEVMHSYEPLSIEAMNLFDRMDEELQDHAVETFGEGTKVYAAGLTPYIVNIRDVANRDQGVVMLLVVPAIGLIVLLWVRRIFLTVCMLAATLMLYFSTLAAADLFCRYALDQQGLDWKVRLFLFVVMMAIGQDYNIFLVARILQEQKTYAVEEATRRAILATGRVISSCGLIMAATLGSLMATGMNFYQQLGFAFAFGVLFDTFIIRPVVVPACHLIGERLSWKKTEDRSRETEE